MKFEKTKVFIPLDGTKDAPLLEMWGFLLNEAQLQQLKREIAKEIWIEFQKESIKRMKSFIESKYKNFPLQP